MVSVSLVMEGGLFVDRMVVVVVEVTNDRMVWVLRQDVVRRMGIFWDGFRMCEALHCEGISVLLQR